MDDVQGILLSEAGLPIYIILLKRKQLAERANSIIYVFPIYVYLLQGSQTFEFLDMLNVAHNHHLHNGNFICLKF